tara:strand:- start:1090 stop:1398 length:309 start_codon:yes stop_codon:yes gene_type:complete
MDYKLLTYYRGDTRPIEAKLTRDGDWTLTGSTVKMTFIFDDAIVHTVVGTVIDEDAKLVEFEPIAAAVATVRQGTFDICVDDGVYVATHIDGIVMITQDRTP